MGALYAIPLYFNDDQMWTEFAVRVINKAEWDLPEELRVGQRLTIAVGEESPWIASAIACDTRCDIWEIDDVNDPKIRAFWERVFELFVESL